MNELEFNKSQQIKKAISQELDHMETKDNWEERFDEAYGSFELGEPVSKGQYDKIKAFIRETLESEKRALINILDDIRAAATKTSVVNPDGQPAITLAELNGILFVFRKQLLQSKRTKEKL